MFRDEIDEPLGFAFLMLDGMSLMSLSSATEPLRAANRLLNREAFRWDLTTLDGSPAMTSAGIPIPAIPVAGAIDKNHALILCGGIRVDLGDERPYLAAMRSGVRAGLAVGALSTASYLLARAGLLDGYRCTIHWESRAAFEEDFPHLDITGTLYETDRNRLTCSGGTASMDLMLHVIAERHGRELANGVANQFHHERLRASSEDQQGGRAQHISALPRSMQVVIRLMQENVASPVSINRLAEQSNVSTRQMERNFRDFLGVNPIRYYLMLRVERAREMLLYTEQPILDIAVATGFASSSHFSKWIKEFYGARPRELRSQARHARTQFRSQP